MIKLNGGLGTSMGMTEPKSLLEVKDGLTFLDIIVRQILDLRASTGARLPLVLMNCFATRDESLARARAVRELAGRGVPADFVQNKVPKLDADDLAPVELAGRPRAGVGAARPRRPLPVARQPRGCSTRCWTPATATPSSPTPTTSARSLDPRILAWFAARAGARS